MTINGILTIYNSQRDSYGNIYYAGALTIGDQEAHGTGYLANVNTLECREKLGWHIEYCELPIREFNRVTKGWPYLGCPWEDIRDNLQTQLKEKGKPT